MSEIRNKAFSGIFWSAIERFSLQGVQFIVMMIMARILMPEDYGLVGMTTIFISLANSLIDSGFSQALIRKIDRTEVDKSTIFYFNIVVGFIIYLIFFCIAPLISGFYDKDILVPLIRIVSLSALVNSFSIVQRAELTISIDFKTQAKASIIASTTSGLLGIYLAYSGFGVWSIVFQQLFSTFINTIILWIYSNWRPCLVFSYESFKEMFGFGNRLLLSGLLDAIYREIYPIIIAKLYSADSLGHYSRAKHFVDFPSASLTGILQKVTYPLLCNIQNDEEKVKLVYRKMIKLSAFVMFPIIICLASVAQPFVILTIGNQWILCGDLLCLLCFASVWYPINAINLNLLQVKGYSNIYLRLEIIKKCMYIIILICTSFFGVKVMCLGQILGSFLAVVINTYYTGVMIDYGFFKQLKDLSPIIIMSIIIFSVNHYLVIPFFSSAVYQLFAGIPVALFICIIFASTLLKDESKLVFDLLEKKNSI